MNYMSEVHFPLDTGDFRLVDRKVMNEFDRFKERGKYIRGLISWVASTKCRFIMSVRRVSPARRNIRLVRC